MMQALTKHVSTGSSCPANTPRNEKIAAESLTVVTLAFVPKKTWRTKNQPTEIMMARERIYLFDTTLRDGAQTRGVDFSVEDKIIIAQALDELGLDYIEGGWPGANPTDTAFFGEQRKFKNAKFTAFGMTKRAGRSAGNDPSLAPVLRAHSEAVCLVGKTWDFHVDVALGITNKENIDSIGESMQAIAEKNKEALFDAEHFFDGYKANPDFALECLKAALQAGARWLVLCDTNGGTLPHEIDTIVRAVTEHISGDSLGIHAHNDTGNAVANSLMAVRAGVRQVQGTLNGLGERCGNANIVTLIPTFLLKPEFSESYEISISTDALQNLTHTSRMLDDVLNQAPYRHAPYVGAAAFAHKGGLHASAVAKDPRTYEHIDPDTVGNERVILMSDQAGRSNVLRNLKHVGIDLPQEDPRVENLLLQVKDLEFQGYSYDNADASFELLARRALDQVPDYFDVDSFRVLTERRHDAKGRLVTVSEATVKLTIAGKRYMSAAEGNGPVNALDTALRSDLGPYAPYIADLRLVDYKVRILNAGTEAVTRVLIESTNAKGERWFTIGVSPNIVDASFQALMDSITFKLFHEKAKPAKS